MWFCVCSMFFCTLICVLSSFAIILMGMRELVVLLHLSSWCLVALTHGAVNWSAVYDCGIFRSFSLTFSILIHSFKIQQKSGMWVITQFLGHRILALRILTSTVCSVGACHIVIVSYTYSSQRWANIQANLSLTCI